MGITKYESTIDNSHVRTNQTHPEQSRTQQHAYIVDDVRSLVAVMDELGLDQTKELVTID